MGRGSAKAQAREIYLKNPKIGLSELHEALDGLVLERTVQKYLIEFRKVYGKEIMDTPDEISMTKLEAELASQLEINPSATVVKSCIDFLKLKQSIGEKSEEIDIEKFIKRGKE